MGEAPKPAQSLALPFPMRGGRYVAQIVIPRDMTKDEADRLCVFVMSLAKPDDSAGGGK